MKRFYFKVDENLREILFYIYDPANINNEKSLNDKIQWQLYLSVQTDRHIRTHVSYSTATAVIIIISYCQRTLMPQIMHF